MTKKLIPTIYISVGVPASGKSYWWKTSIEHGLIPENATMYISPDFWSGEFGFEGSDDIVNRYCISLLKNAISLKLPLIYCDGYFITKKIRKPIIDIALKTGYKVVIIWFNPPLSKCIERKPDLEKKINIINEIINNDPPDMNEKVDNIWIVKS